MSMTKPCSAMAWPLMEWPFPLAATVRLGERHAALMTFATSSGVEGRIKAKGFKE